MGKDQVKSSRISRRRFLKGATGALISTSMIGSLTTRGQSTVKLGVIWPLGVNPAGLEMQKGAQYAAELVNTKQPLQYPELIPVWEGLPNLGNRKLELVFANHDFDPELGAKLVGDLKSQGAVGILGALSSSVTDKVSEAAAEAGLPMITSSALLSPLTKRGIDSFFRICSDNMQGAKALFAALSNFMDELSEEEKKLVPTNYVYLVVEYPGVEKDMETIKSFAEQGVEGEFEGRFTFQPIVIETGTTLGDIAHQVQALKLTADDALMPVLFSNEVLFLMKEMIKQIPDVNNRPGLVFIDPFLSTLQGVVQALSPEEMRGWRWTLTNIQFFPAVFNADADFASDFIGPFRDGFTNNVGPPNPLNALGFTGVHAWAAILNQAGSTKPSDIVKAANQIELRDIMITNWNGIRFGETRFGDKGANIDVIPGTAHLDEQGSLQVVELPGGFTPSQNYANLNIITNYSCLMNCVSIGINASITQLESISTTTIDNHARYRWDSHNTSTTTTTTETTATGAATDVGLCFLTTACVKARNLPDDCAELNILRAFRDNYVRNLPEGERVIQEYYDIAPKIVKKINQSKNALNIWKDLYHSLVDKSVKLIQAGRKSEAYENYKSIVKELKRRYL